MSFLFISIDSLLQKRSPKCRVEAPCMWYQWQSSLSSSNQQAPSGLNPCMKGRNVDTAAQFDSPAAKIKCTEEVSRSDEVRSMCAEPAGPRGPAASFAGCIHTLTSGSCCQQNSMQQLGKSYTQNTTQHFHLPSIESLATMGDKRGVGGLVGLLALLILLWLGLSCQSDQM